jgi:ElaB/YqjD/DUF883 family membrane-anchored ribosome-binding protein
LSALKAITGTVSDFGKDAAASIDELGRFAGKGFDEAREETGEALHAAAASVRTAGRRGSEAIDNIAASAADRLDTTASYVEEHGLKELSNGLRRLCRRHLTGALVASAAVGFLAGAALGRKARLCGGPAGRA